MKTVAGMNTRIWSEPHPTRFLCVTTQGPPDPLGAVYSRSDLFRFPHLNPQPIHLKLVFLMKPFLLLFFQETLALCGHGDIRSEMSQWGTLKNTTTHKLSVQGGGGGVAQWEEQTPS